jgi:hypothetical protein
MDPCGLWLETTFPQSFEDQYNVDKNTDNC